MDKIYKKMVMVSHPLIQQLYDHALSLLALLMVSHPLIRQLYDHALSLLALLMVSHPLIQQLYDHALSLLALLMVYVSSSMVGTTLFPPESRASPHSMHSSTVFQNPRS